MFEPIIKFPNNVFIPKIVPLVYDDTLSYYEFLCKVLNKMNEAIEALNALGVKVDALEQAVAQLQAKVAEFEDRISQNEADIATLQGLVTEINTAISGINQTIEGLSSQVSNNTTNITILTGSVNSINSTISDIQDAIERIGQEAGDIPEIQGDIDALDTRVSNLENATFGTVTANPMNVNFSYDLRDPDAVDFDIVKISGEFTNDDIFISGDGHITFYHDETSNTCKLVLKNVFSDISDYISDLDTEVVNLAFMITRVDNYHYYTINNGLTISQLLTGYSGDDYFKTIKLVRNTNGNFDLEIQQIPNTIYLRISLDFLFITLGQVPVTAAMLKDFIGNPSQNLLGIIKKNSKNYDTVISNIQQDVQDLEDDTDILSSRITNEATARENADNTLSGRITNNSNSISSIQSAVNSIETVNTWTSFSDVFENPVIPSGAAIKYFKCTKVNKSVRMEIAGVNFMTDATYRFGTFKLGTLRAGVRAALTPKDGLEVTGFGVSTQTMNNGQAIAVNGSIENPAVSPILLDGDTLAIGVLTGSETGNPWWPTYPGGSLPAHSLFVNTNASMQDNMHSSFVIVLNYMTN